jgi:hypothetical protein
MPRREGEPAWLYAWRLRVVSDAGPPPMRRVLLLILWWDCERHGFPTSPHPVGASELAVFASLALRTVRRHMAVAVEEGWVERTGAGWLPVGGP